MVVGFGHSLRLFTFDSLIFRPSRVMLNPRNVVVFCSQLHSFSLQQNSCLCQHENTFSSSLKCSSYVVVYMSMSYKKTTNPLFSIFMNTLFIICMNVAGAFVRPIGIKIHLYSPYQVKNTVFITFLLLYSTSSNHCEYPMM